MKKYILGVLVGFSMLLAPFAHADVPTGIQGFSDGSFYDKSGTLKYQCFMDGSCYDLLGVPAPFKVVAIDYVAPVVTPTTTGNAIDTEKADRVKNEISSYISGLNGQINTLNNTALPNTGIIYNNQGPTPYQIVLLEDYPSGEKLFVKDISSIKQYPAGFPDNARKVVTDSQSQISKLQATISEANRISFTIDDYLFTGMLPSSSDRTYLQSLGINW